MSYARNNHYAGDFIYRVPDLLDTYFQQGYIYKEGTITSNHRVMLLQQNASAEAVFTSYLYGMNSNTGKWIILAGLAIVLAGIVVYFFSDKLRWLGHLPGDIRMEKENVRFYFPVTTMILVSLILSLGLYIIRKFLG
jgi:hypothetical protein